MILDLEENQLRPALRKAFKGGGFVSTRATQTTITIEDYRDGVNRENRKTPRIYFTRKPNGTDVLITCKSAGETQNDFRHKIPAKGIEMRVEGSSYRSYKNAFEINPRDIPPMIESLTEWIKRELE